MRIENLLGQKVTLVGTAMDAKGGTVLITMENDVIYIKELYSWPSELFDKRVSVSGILKKEKFIPDPIIEKNGAISAGALINYINLSIIKRKIQ